MTEQEKTMLRERLNSKLIELENKIEELEELTQPVAPDVAIGRISRMDAINNRSVNEMALRQAKEKQLKIQHALSLIDKPDYGLCSRCGKAIPIGRLMALPESNKCVSCS